MTVLYWSTCDWITDWLSTISSCPPLYNVELVSRFPHPDMAKNTAYMAQNTYYSIRFFKSKVIVFSVKISIQAIGAFYHQTHSLTFIIQRRNWSDMNYGSSLSLQCIYQRSSMNCSYKTVWKRHESSLFSIPSPSTFGWFENVCIDKEQDLQVTMKIMVKTCCLIINSFHCLQP